MIKRVFLLAHGDDELFCLPLITEENVESTLIFFTSRIRSNQESIENQSRRNEIFEAGEFLSRFSVKSVLIVSPELFDSEISSDFDKIHFEFLRKIIVEVNADEIVSLTYEGGHHDHDTVEFVSRLVSQELKIGLRSVSAYRSINFAPMMFHVLKPEFYVESFKFNRIKVSLVLIKLFMIYKSQTRTWIGLGPFLLFRYLFSRYRFSQVSNSLKLDQMDNCFYEVRGREVQVQHLSKLRGLQKRVIVSTQPPNLTDQN